MGKPNGAVAVWSSPILESKQVLCPKGKDRRQAGRLRIMFNEVMWKMVTDDEEQNKISK